MPARFWVWMTTEVASTKACSVCEAISQSMGEYDPTVVVRISGSEGNVVLSMQPTR
jgi:hypothetical protein